MSALQFEATEEIEHRRRLLWAMPSGIYVLGSTAGPSGPYNLMTHSLAVQAAVEPCVVAVAVERAARTHELIAASQVCTLSVLHRAQRPIVRKFVKPVDDVDMDEGGRPVAMGGVEVAIAPSGAPFVAAAAGCLDLRVLETVTFVSHSLFCCEVTSVAVAPAVLEGTASQRLAEVLRMEDTKMSYGG